MSKYLKLLTRLVFINYSVSIGIMKHDCYLIYVDIAI